MTFSKANPLIAKYLTDSFISELSTLKWSQKRIWEWYNKQPFLAGCNYIPSNSINQLEMFQADTFDPIRIDEELGWAEDIGFNTLRVYLHFFLWEQDKEGLFTRMDRFLSICEKHHMKVMYVLFDDCHRQNPKPGLQPIPSPGIHNSGWAASPGRAQARDPKKWEQLEAYVKETIFKFRDDGRILAWDLYNEPGNHSNIDYFLPLLTASLSWAREVDPSQPITVAVFIWKRIQKLLTKHFRDLLKITIASTDFISFHNYSHLCNLKMEVKYLRKFNRPIICSEWMARHFKSIFKTHLPYFVKEKIGCINWGFVSGKTQTIYKWGSKKTTSEPSLWFHDILREDGTPYKQSEVKLIRESLLPNPKSL